jgi:hypothetical protein
MNADQIACSQVMGISLGMIGLLLILIEKGGESYEFF